MRNVRARSRSAVLSSPELVDGGLTDSLPCEGVGEAGLFSFSGMDEFKRISTMASQSYGIPSAASSAVQSSSYNL